MLYSLFLRLGDLPDDRYQVLTTGELLIHKTNMADKERTYRCRVQDTITNRILVSAKPATAYIVGKCKNDTEYIETDTYHQLIKGDLWLCEWI